ncbi:hypothetical protein GE107_10700 [Cohnella sp. CFH 77786]|uniref:hypothetical protein n=1 Tax=Cohnella sp. CFH 77786 TaxID=2662265 RepID=UPI001C60A537|nr:hypothetical protein [Cohnella sp. CFH 77786]MBW5446527.1 hypothetical protein [Cohnella sp. CFH 77786]
MDLQKLYPIVDLLDKHQIPYALGGSAMLYDLRLIEEVNDWDITVECPKQEILEILNEYDCVEQRSGDFPFASEYRISIPELKLDIIGFFGLHTDTGIVTLPVSHGSDWDGIKVSSPEIWYVAYSLMKRKRKSEVLMDYLKSNIGTVNKELVEFLIKMPHLTRGVRDELIQLIKTSSQ